MLAILAEEGHHIGYAGCQNPKHDPDWKTPWPLGHKEKEQNLNYYP